MTARPPREIWQPLLLGSVGGALGCGTVLLATRIAYSAGLLTWIENHQGLATWFGTLVAIAGAYALQERQRAHDKADQIKAAADAENSRVNDRMEGRVRAQERLLLLSTSVCSILRFAAEETREPSSVKSRANILGQVRNRRDLLISLIRTTEWDAKDYGHAVALLSRVEIIEIGLRSAILDQAAADIIYPKLKAQFESAERGRQRIYARAGKPAPALKGGVLSLIEPPQSEDSRA